MADKKWGFDQIADQDGRIAVVTGSSSGIGYAAARMLAAKKAEVILAVRNQAKGDHAADKIRQAHPGATVTVMMLDLAELASVRRFAQDYKSAYQKLDLLINNAGVMIPPYGKTVDGFELQIGTNHLGHFALTGLLMDLLKSTPGSRVINVSSVAHQRGNIDFDDLNWEKRSYSPSRAYGDSKIANLYFTSELTRRLGDSVKQPLVTSAHPGWTSTELQRHSGLMNFLNRFFGQGIDMGALPTLRAAVDEAASGGDYYGPSGFMEMNGFPVKVKTNKLARDEKIARQLWDLSESLTGVSY